MFQSVISIVTHHLIFPRKNLEACEHETDFFAGGNPKILPRTREPRDLVLIALGRVTSSLKFDANVRAEIRLRV